MSDQTWQERAAAKRAANDALIPDELRIINPTDRNVVHFPQTCGLLSARELEITDVETVQMLLDRLANGMYTAFEVTEAFNKRATIAHQLVNAFTQTFFDRARARAKELDEHYATTGKTVGPLHGLPISLKEQIQMEGTECNMGLVSWIGNISTKNAVIVDILHKQGAVFYCRTNMSQCLAHADGRNNVYKWTLNPANRDLTSGGSIAGEGVLLALRGSILGVGSDYGSSVRHPAASNGVYGLRGCYWRIPVQGICDPMPGAQLIQSVLGPLSASLDGLKIFHKAVLDSEPWQLDPTAPRMPWDEAAYNFKDHGGAPDAKLCFGIMWDDELVLPNPPYKRALEITKKALLAAGHEVVDWEPYKQAEGYALSDEIWVAAGKYYFRDVVKSGEPILKEKPGVADVEIVAHQVFDLFHKRNQFMKASLDHWNATISRTTTGRPIDAIIAPIAADPPSPHGSLFYHGYTGFCNWLDYAASTFPVTKVIPEVDVAVDAHEFRCERDRYAFENYDAEGMRDAPIGLQCIGQRYEEEAVIRMTEVIVEALAKAREV